MTDVNELINALNSGDNVEAGNAFNDVMLDKISSALDARKIDVAQSMMSDSPEIEEDEFNTGEVEDEDISSAEEY
jgi:hypothetical protein